MITRRKSFFETNSYDPKIPAAKRKETKLLTRRSLDFPVVIGEKSNRPHSACCRKTLLLCCAAESGKRKPERSQSPSYVLELSLEKKEEDRSEIRVPYPGDSKMSLTPNSRASESDRQRSACAHELLTAVASQGIYTYMSQKYHRENTR